MKITVVGMGYVGLSNAVLLSQEHEVVGVDLEQSKIDKLRDKISPIDDKLIAEYLETKDLKLDFTTNLLEALPGSDYVVIATPTDYDPERDYFNTQSIESVAKAVTEREPSACIIIKSTIPIGFTLGLRGTLSNNHIIYSPEFLREGTALQDLLYPNRIVMGDNTVHAICFADELRSCSRVPETEVILTGSSEAESIKLFSNTYLAMRVAYFNELDTFAETHGLKAADIIDGVSGDSRIGCHYNNPSFGYGGYCFPKDTKQLRANFNSSDTPNSLITSIVNSNEIRMVHIADQIMAKKPKVVGVHRLTMKANSDNFRSSAILSVIELIREDVEILIFEPMCEAIGGFEVVRDLEDFKSRSDVIITNRMDETLDDVSDKIYTRDIYHADI